MALHITCSFSNWIVWCFIVEFWELFMLAMSLWSDICFAQLAQLICKTIHEEDAKVIPRYWMRKRRPWGQHPAWQAADGQWIITVNYADGAQTVSLVEMVRLLEIRMGRWKLKPAVSRFVTKSCLTVATPWAVGHQAPLSMGFPRQEYWSGLPFPPPGDLPKPATESALQADSLPTELR